MCKTVTELLEVKKKTRNFFTHHSLDGRRTKLYELITVRHKLAHTFL